MARAAAMALCLLALCARAERLDHRNPEALLAAGRCMPGRGDRRAGGRAARNNLNGRTMSLSPCAHRKLMQANRELLAHPTIINGADAVQGRVSLGGGWGHASAAARAHPSPSLGAPFCCCCSTPILFLCAPLMVPS